MSEFSRTLLICATVGFLGWLGFVLAKNRLSNPAPQVVTIPDKELEELRAKLDVLKQDSQQQTD